MAVEASGPSTAFGQGFSDGGHSGAPQSGEPGIHFPEARVHGFRASPCGRSRNDGLLLGEIKIKIAPIRIGLLDQPDLPITPPFLDFFLSSDR